MDDLCIMPQITLNFVRNIVFFPPQNITNLIKVLVKSQPSMIKRERGTPDT